MFRPSCTVKLYRSAARSHKSLPGFQRAQTGRSSSSSSAVGPTSSTRSTAVYWLGGAAVTVTLFTLLNSRRPTLALDAPFSSPRRELTNSKQLREVTSEEMGKHSTVDDAWVVIDSIVYDVTDFVLQHPAGPAVIVEHIGKDITALFNLLHSSEVLPKVLPKLGVVGTLAPGAEIEIVPSMEDEDEVQDRRDELPHPDYVVNLNEFERMAKEVLGEDSRGWKFISSYADDGRTYTSTRDSFSFLRFIPRVNRPVAEVSTTTTFLGLAHPFPLPIFMAPTGASAQAHPDGELNLTRAASVTGVPQIVSTMASVSFLDCARERDALQAAGHQRAPLMWQLYIFNNRAESEKRIQDAVRGGAEAIVITVDVAAMGNREADAKVAKGPGGGAKPAGGVAASSQKLMDANMTWADIAWVQKHAPGLPVLVKGITSVADVALAKQHGARGVLLSNHGGRQLDGAPPPLATLVRLRMERPDLLKDDRFDVWIDGGVRRGTDVLKALCLGARGVGLGRTMLYAQACYGEQGVIRATEIMRAEIERGMRLLGAASISDLKPEMIELLDGLVGKQMS